MAHLSFNMFYVVLPQIHRWTLISLKDYKYFIKSIIKTVFLERFEQVFVENYHISLSKLHIRNSFEALIS